jgi:hypothetical protein
MSDYYSDGQGTLSISSDKSEVGLQVGEKSADGSSFSSGEEEYMSSHVTEQGRKLSLASIPAAEVLFCQQTPVFFRN